MTARLRRPGGATDLNLCETWDQTLPASWLRPVDLLVLLFSTLFLSFTLVLWTRLPGRVWFVLADVLLATAVISLRPGLIGESSKLWWVRNFYPAPVIYLFYRQSCLIAQALHHGQVFDTVLVKADRWLFTTDPTRWLGSYSNPLVTEVLQLAYTSFYLLLLLVAWDLLHSGKRLQFEVFSFGVVYGFSLSQVGYWLLPSVGPRFVLHRFSGLDSELPGLFLTPYLRAFVNWGGAIAQGGNDQSTMAQALPDVFPSGHAMMTIALIFWAFKFSSRVRWPVSVAGSLLIVSTVYLRYHYVVDVWAGAGLALFCLASHTRLYQLTQTLLAVVAGVRPENVERSA